MRALIESVQAPAKPGLDIDDSWVTVPAEVGDVRVRIVKPKGAPGRLPVVLYLHGGGWVVGSAVSHDRLTREIAVGAEAAVVFVEYSLAPEARHPVQLEQAYAAAARRCPARHAPSWWSMVSGQSSGALVRSLRISVPDEQLADLHRRLLATRWPDARGLRSHGVPVFRLFYANELGLPARFPALQQPDLLIAELRRCFASRTWLS